MCPSSPPPPLLLTRTQVRALDAAAATELAIPTLLLMENAAASLERHTLELLASITPRPNTTTADLALVFCGPGSNGGDGYALARRLHIHNLVVQIIAVGPPPKPGTDAAINRAVAERLNLPITPADDGRADINALCAPMIVAAPRAVLIDALLGTGAARPLDAAMSRAVRTINTLRAAHPHARTLAVDLPTGLDADSGFPLQTQTLSITHAAYEPPAVVHADLTVTLAAMKPGLALPHARPYTGAIEVGDIGLPRHFIARFAT